MRRFLITAEAVTEGHPDKIADQIADAVLDDIVRQDKYGKCSCEIMVGNNYVVVAGEVSTMAWVDYNNLIRKVIKEIGYDKEEYGFCHKNTAIMNAVNRQSPEVGKLVRRAGSKKQGAGDQGVSVGYACRETPEMIPLAHAMVQKLAARLADVRKKKILGYLRPDGKCQLTLEYKNNVAFRLENVVVSAQHDPKVAYAKIKQDIIDKVIKPVCGTFLDKQTRVYVNQRGRFVIGGPAADTGATGRKIITDTYGSTVPSGGSSFSGKDATKIDRTGAYMARYIAKNIVAADLADECFVRLAYIIGDTCPVEFSVETFGTNKVNEEVLEAAAGKVFDLSPGGMIRQLKLMRPIYRKTSNYGHFGREEPEFTWERKDMVKKLQKEIARISKKNEKLRLKQRAKG